MAMKVILLITDKYLSFPFSIEFIKKVMYNHV